MAAATLADYTSGTRIWPSEAQFLGWTGGSSVGRKAGIVCHTLGMAVGGKHGPSPVHVIQADNHLAAFPQPLPLSYLPMGPLY